MDQHFSRSAGLAGGAVLAGVTLAAARSPAAAQAATYLASNACSIEPGASHFVAEQAVKSGSGVTHPKKIVCSGFNCRKHAADTGQPAGAADAVQQVQYRAQVLRRRDRPCPRRRRRTSTTRPSW